MHTRWIASPSLATLATTLALAGCYRVPAGPSPDPAPPASAAPAVGWPTRLEFDIDNRSEELKHGGVAKFSIELRIPVFDSEPPGVAAELNARLAKLARPDVDPRTHEGRYELECSVELANRYAVIVDCSQLLEEYAHSEDEQAPGDAAAEPRRLAFGWWLRRGLPDLSLEQFAPQFDLRAAIEAELPSQPAGCELHACAFDPKSFVIDSEGITLVPTGDCSAECDASIPSIPLDRLAPTHAWAAELVKRVRRRVEAGDLLVEGDRTY